MGTASSGSRASGALERLDTTMRMARAKLGPDITIQRLLILINVYLNEGLSQSELLQRLDSTSVTALSRNLADLSAVTTKKRRGPGLIALRVDPMNLRRKTGSPDGQGPTVAQSDRALTALTHERTNARTHERTNARTHERTNARTHERTNARTHERTNARTHERTNARTHERTNARTHERTNARTHERTNARTHERTNARTHERAMCAEVADADSPLCGTEPRVRRGHAHHAQHAQATRAIWCVLEISRYQRGVVRTEKVRECERHRVRSSG